MCEGEGEREGTHVPICRVITYFSRSSFGKLDWLSDIRLMKTNTEDRQVDSRSVGQESWSQ